MFYVVSYSAPFKVFFSFVDLGLLSRLFFLGLFSLFSLFVFFRFPYVCGGVGFFEIVFISVLYLFIVLYVRCFFYDTSLFFCCFVQEGCVLPISWFTFGIELVSYFIRPFVTFLRPCINLGLGYRVSTILWNVFLVSSIRRSFVVFLILCLFFYEAFLTILHWYIVNQILSFSDLY